MKRGNMAMESNSPSQCLLDECQPQSKQVTQQEEDLSRKKTNGQEHQVESFVLEKLKTYEKERPYLKTRVDTT